MGRAYHEKGEEITTMWGLFENHLREVKPNIDSMYEALDKGDKEIVGDQIAMVMTKILEAYSRMRAYYYIEGLMEIEALP